MIVVVVTHNSSADISNCLRSLDGYDTVVVDNASADETRHIVSAFPQTDLVHLSRNQGLAVAVNVGLERVGRDDALVLNPDVVVHDGAIDHLCSYLSGHPEVGVVAPILRNVDGSLQDSLRTFPTPLSMAARRTPLGATRLGRKVLARHVLVEPEPTAPKAVDWALGAALMVRRAAMDDVGGMDESFFLYSEDVDWCLRMWKQGWEVHCCPAAVMTHTLRRASRATFDLSNAATRHHWRSAARLFMHHPVLLTGFTRVGDRHTPLDRDPVMPR